MTAQLSALSLPKLTRVKWGWMRKKWNSSLTSIQSFISKIPNSTAWLWNCDSLFISQLGSCPLILLNPENIIVNKHNLTMNPPNISSLYFSFPCQVVSQSSTHQLTFHAFIEQYSVLGHLICTIWVPQVVFVNVPRIIVIN